MNMIEKVTHAIREKTAEIDHRPGVIDADPMYFADEYARAAIEAMREPTEEMRDRYNDPDIVGYGPDGSDHDKVWQAGIDAALSEPCQTSTTDAT